MSVEIINHVLSFVDNPKSKVLNKEIYNYVKKDENNIYWKDKYDKEVKLLDKNYLEYFDESVFDYRNKNYRVCSNYQSADMIERIRDLYFILNNNDFYFKKSGNYEAKYLLKQHREYLKATYKYKYLKYKSINDEIYEYNKRRLLKNFICEYAYLYKKNYI